MDRRLEDVAKAVGGGSSQLPMPLKLALAVREAVAGQRLGALAGGGGTRCVTFRLVVVPPLPMHPWGQGPQNGGGFGVPIGEQMMWREAIVDTFLRAPGAFSGRYPLNCSRSPPLRGGRGGGHCVQGRWSQRPLRSYCTRAGAEEGEHGSAAAGRARTAMTRDVPLPSPPPPV